MRLPGGSARRKRMVKGIAVALGFRPSRARTVPSVLGLPLSDSHILVDFLPHIPCELSAVLDGLEIGPA